jgi:hypothetical protein
VWARASRGLVLTSGVIASSRMQSRKVSMPSDEVESGRRAAVQDEAIALGTGSSRIQKVRGFKEAEKHRDSWRMWGHEQSSNNCQCAANSRPLHLCCSLPFDRQMSPRLESVLSVGQVVSNKSTILKFVVVRRGEAPHRSVHRKRVKPNTRRDAFTSLPQRSGLQHVCSGTYHCRQRFGIL